MIWSLFSVIFDIVVRPLYLQSWHNCYITELNFIFNLTFRLQAVVRRLRKTMGKFCRHVVIPMGKACLWHKKQAPAIGIPLGKNINTVLIMNSLVPGTRDRFFSSHSDPFSHHIVIPMWKGCLWQRFTCPVKFIPPEGGYLRQKRREAISQGEPRGGIKTRKNT